MNDSAAPFGTDLDNLPVEAARRGEDAEQQVRLAMRRHRDSVLPALIDRREHKLVREHEAAELAIGFEHRRQALTMALESRLQSIREACNHVLVTGKTHLRQQRIEYFGEVYRQVEQRMNRLADDFLAEADRRFARIASIQSEHLRQREQQRQEKAAEDFFVTLDQLMAEFRSIISEHVDHRGGS
jgi:NADH dehydrogenase/NADH:ubiquinone oxidoreductase subunit G